MNPVPIEVEIEDPAWTQALPDAAAVTVRAALAAFAGAGRDPGPVVVLLADDAALQDLNGRFRDRPAPTNVLSFPAAAGPDDHLGDLALAFGVCAQEARAQGKTLADHLTHLTVHGVLHLLGYDHEALDEAEAMEALERRILADLGVADPYGDTAADIHPMQPDDGDHAQRL